jgi:DNA processing protein
MVRQIVQDDPQFPERLLMIKPAIKKLWYRGELDTHLFARSVAIVGSRRMSRYGRAVIEDIVPKLCLSGHTIVSGLMYGVDQLVHQKTLECGGIAVAVLGWGIERRNDPESDRLAEEIVKQGGVVLSEYPQDARGQLWTFPQRNRIVVGLSNLVIVVEAGIKSGTMSTVKWAEKIGKPVYAVPGSMFASSSEGANYMIEVGLAKPLTQKVIDDLCSQHSERRADKKGGQGDLSEEEKVVLRRLSLVGASSINEISRGVDLGVGEILSAISSLEMKGIVTEERGIFAIV